MAYFVFVFFWTCPVSFIFAAPLLSLIRIRPGREGPGFLQELVVRMADWSTGQTLTTERHDPFGCFSESE